MRLDDTRTNAAVMRVVFPLRLDSQLKRLDFPVDKVQNLQQMLDPDWNDPY